MLRWLAPMVVTAACAHHPAAAPENVSAEPAAASAPVAAHPDPDRWSVTIDVTVDDHAEHGPVRAVLEAARPALEACLHDHTRTASGTTFDVDAAGAPRLPFIDHPFPTQACLMGALGALAFPAGAARVVKVQIIGATEAERAAGSGAPAR
jgi:hypothetical protein